MASKSTHIAVSEQKYLPLNAPEIIKMYGKAMLKVRKKRLGPAKG